MMSLKQKNERKLLAAVAVLAVMFAGVAVIVSDSDVDAETVAEKDFLKGIGEGQFTVDKDMEVTLTKPLDISNNTTIAGTTGNTLTIKFAATEKLQAMVNLGAVLNIKNVNVKFVLTSGLETKDKTDGLTVFGGESGLNVTDGAVVTISQAADAYGASWRAGTLTINKATVDFNKANSTGALEVNVTDGKLLFTNPNASAGNLKGSIKGESSVIASGTLGKNLNLYSVTVDAKSSISTDGVLGIYEGQTVTGTSGAKITADTMTVIASSTTNDAPKITDANVTANIVKPTGETTASIALEGVGFSGKSSIGKGMNATGNITINTGATLVLDNSVTMAITNNGSLSIGDGVTTEGITLDSSSTGTIGSQNSSDAYLGGVIDKTSTSTSFGAGQIVNIVEDLKIDGAVVTIDGTLVIPEGKTVEIVNGGRLVLDEITGVLMNNGTIIVSTELTGKNNYSLFIEKATVNNNGTIQISYDGENASADVAKFAGVMNNNGTITMDNLKNNSMVIAGTFNNKETGKIDLRGTVKMEAAILNEGAVNIDGKLVSENGQRNVYNIADGANVTITSLDGALRIDDIKFTEVGNNVFEGGSNDVVVSSADGFAVGGLTIVTNVAVDGKKYSRSMDVSGTVVVPKDKTATVKIEGPNVVVSKDLSIPTSVKLEVIGDLAVDGTINAASDAKIDVTGSVTVSGKIVFVQGEITGTGVVNAARYKVTDATNTAAFTTYYTTVEAAIASGAKEIAITGTVTVKEDVTIPAEVKVTQEEGKITISDGVTVTVADGGKLVQTAGEIQVDGTLYVTVESTGIAASENGIKSHVLSRGEKDVRYTNLYTAMDMAADGDVITLNTSPVNVDKDLTIKQGVTVKIESNKVLNVKGSALTIDGTLYINGGQFNVMKNDADVAGKVVLNGFITSDNPLTYTDGVTFPAGAYFSITNKGSVLYYITPVAYSATVINTVDDSTVNIYGAADMGTVEFDGTETIPAIVNVWGNAKADTVTISNAVVNIRGDVTFNGTVKNAAGAVLMKNATASGTGIVFESADVFTVSGSFADAGDNYDVVMSGNVTVSNLNIDTLTVDGTVTVTEKMTVRKVLNVNGTVDVAENKILEIVNGTANVMGVLNSKGTTTVKVLYAGIAADPVGATASVTGNVKVTGTAYFYAGIAVPESISKDTALKSTEFVAEDSLWMTVFGINKVVVKKAPVTDAIFNGWYSESGEKFDKNAELTLGTPAKLFADVKYDIYNVKIVADNGVGTVSIDGIVLQKNSNVFEMNGLTAGEHTISFELKSGYEGTIKMTVNGESVDGFKFTASGVPANGDSITYNITLSGTAPQQGGVKPNDDGMSLTDILLIILVVMVVILAIVVILRMMRS